MKHTVHAEPRRGQKSTQKIHSLTSHGDLKHITLGDKMAFERFSYKSPTEGNTPDTWFQLIKFFCSTRHLATGIFSTLRLVKNAFLGKNYPSICVLYHSG